MAVKAYAVKQAKGKLEPFEYEPGPLGADEVDVKVSHCGICHSDLAMIDDDFGTSQYPLVPGHEVIGTVSAVGSAVDGVKVGQRVGVGWHNASCGRCEWCVRGRKCFCEQEKATIVGHHGGWADSVRAKWNFAVPIPDGLDPAKAGPLMCAGATVFTPMYQFGVTPSMIAAVVGVGGLGHLAVQFLAAFGCDVTAISTSHDKDEKSKALGARHFIATKGTDELKEAKGRFDFIISTVDADIPWDDYVGALRPQGRLALVGIPPKPVALNVFGLLAEKSFSGGSCGSPSDTATMLEFAARHGIAAVTEDFALSDCNKAVGHVRAGKARFRVVLSA